MVPPQGDSAIGANHSKSQSSDRTAEQLSTGRQAARGTRWLDRVPAPAVWLLELSIWSTLFVWAYVDSRFAIACDALEELFRHRGTADSSRLLSLGARLGWLGWREWWIASMIVAALALAVLLLVQLPLGPRANRGVRGWLGAAIVLGLSLAWFGAWRDVAWLGQRQRVAADLALYESLAEPLRHTWPQTDGDLPQLGPFMAYPIDHPTTLMLLTRTDLGHDVRRVCQIDRSDRGALRFLLAGAELQEWLEWHPADSRPESFVSATLVKYELQRASKLDGNWYLASYQTSRIN